MRYLLYILMMFPLQGFSQLFKVVPEGLIFVNDSIHQKKLSPETFTTYMGAPYSFDIEEERNAFLGKLFKADYYDTNLIVAKTKNGWGCINKVGKELIPFTFQYDLHFFSDYKYWGGYFQDKKNNWSFKIMDFAGKVKGEYNAYSSSNSSIYIMQDKSSKLYGVIDNNLNTILPFEYTGIDDYSDYFYFSENGFLTLKNTEGKMGVINDKGQIVLKFIYDKIELPDNGYKRGLITYNWQLGVIDSQSNIVIEPQYGEIILGYKIILAHTYGEHWVAYDSIYQPIKTLDFDYVDRAITIYQPVGIVGENNKYGVFDINSGKFLLNMEYDSIVKFEIGKTYSGIYSYVAQKGDTCFFYNDSLKTMHGIKASEINSMSSCPYLVARDSEHSFLLSFTGERISPSYDLIEPHKLYDYNGTFFIIKDGKAGWVNEKLETIIPTEYDAGCPSNRQYDKTNKNWIVSYTMIKDDWIYLFDEKGNLIQKRPWDHFANFCK